MQKVDSQNRRAGILDVKADLDLLIHIFCFVSVLLIGADRWGINIGVNIRLDQLFLAVFVVLLAAKDVYALTFEPWTVVFAAGAFVSAIFAASITRAVAFWLSVIYNIFIIFYGFSSYVRHYGLNVFAGVLRKTLYVQFAVLVVQYLLMVIFGYELPFLTAYGYVKDVPRFQLWFYEPSYLATYLVFWFALSVYMLMLGKDKSYIKDIIICLAMFLISTATTGFIGIALVVASVYALWFFKGKISFKKIVFPVGVILLFIAFRLIFPSVYELFFARIFNMSLDDASGGRIARWGETFEVFKANPVLGVGPGNYGVYLGKGTAYVPTNASLDLLATLGIVGFIAFYGLTVSLIVNCFKIRKNIKNGETMLLMACAYALLIFTILLQANQGYLRLYHWMFFGVLRGGVLKYGKKKRS